MRQLYCILIFCLTTNFIFAQSGEKIEYLDNIAKFDISQIFNLKTIKSNDTTFYNIDEPIGFIGENYQRLYIHFISVIQNPDNKLEYEVSGKSKVKNNVFDFHGFINITEAKLYSEGVVKSLKQGFFIGTYEFYENPDKNGTGMFKGTFKSNFLLDKVGKPVYDDFLLGADGFRNNQFQGTWKSYKSSVTKICNWGDYRIPQSETLDFGAAEFWPAERYQKYGWENYTSTLSNIESKTDKWWIENNIDSTFYLYYSFSGLGSNRGSNFPVIKVNGTKLIYTYEQTSSWTSELSKDKDTILVCTMRSASIDSIKSIVKTLKDSTIFKSNPCIMSGGVHYLRVVNAKDTVTFELMNTFHYRALEITNILNNYLPKDKKIWANEKLVKEEEECWEYKRKQRSLDKKKSNK